MILRKRVLLAIATALALNACSTPTAPQSPAQAVFALKASEGAALAFALQYKALPSCSVPVHPVVCSNPSTVAKIQEQDKLAASAIDEAEKIIRNPIATPTDITSGLLAAKQAVIALNTILASVKVK